MAESLESLVEKFRINLTETIQKLEEENREKDAALETQHKQEMELLGEKEKIEREKLDATQKFEREKLDATQKFEREELIVKQSQRAKDLTVKQHQEKEILKNYYGEKMKEATMVNKMCPNTSKKEVPECPVCLEPMNPPMRIFQCSYGHYICEDCNNNKEIKSCPTCRRKIVGRNIGMEQAIQLIGSPTDIPRGHQREVVQNEQKSGVGSQIDDRGLTCDRCTLINKEGAKKCDACGRPLGMPFRMVPIPIRPAYSANNLEYHGRRGQRPAHRGHILTLQVPNPPLTAHSGHGHGQSSVGVGCSQISSHSGHGQSSVAEGRRGKSTARGVYGQSSVGEGRGNILLGVGRGRYRSLLQPTASGQSHPVDVGRGFPQNVSRVNTAIPSHRFPPPVPAGRAMGAIRFRIQDVPTGRLVNLETQSPPGKSTSTGRQEWERRRGARDFSKPCGERIDNWDFVYDSLADDLGLD